MPERRGMGERWGTNAHCAVAVGVKGVEDEVRKLGRVLLRERLGELLAAHLLLGGAGDLFECCHCVLVGLLAHCVCALCTKDRRDEKNDEMVDGRGVKKKKAKEDDKPP